MAGGFVVAIAAAVLLGVPALATPGAPGAPTPVGNAAPLPAVSGACPGPQVPASYSGRLAVDGTAVPAPSVVNRTVEVGYEVELNYTPKLTGVSQYSCSTYFASARTGPGGNVSLTASVPATACNSYSCSVYTGPYGPPSFFVALVPAGYFLTVNRTGSSVALAFVEALTATTLTPAIRATLSVNAPTPVAASAWAGDASPSPANLAYAWSLSGTGWFVAAGNGTARITVEALPGAAPALLEVNVSGTFNGTALATVAGRLDLAAAATATTAGSLTATSVDAGSALGFEVDGTGAYGYAYTATFDPGLGGATVVASCGATPIAGGEVALACPGTAMYPSAGTAQPVASLSNGFSSATWTFASVTVAAGLSVAVAPAPVVAYAGAPASLDVRVAAGSGTDPLGPACLWTGDGRLLCAGGGGPDFPFTVTYGTAGTYAGRASVADAGGGNASATFAAAIYARPSLGPVATSLNRLNVGTNVTLTTYVTGGALPLAYWWNTSNPSGTVLAGSLARDGSLVLTWRPTAAGPTQLNLTVVDALGTHLADRVDLAVLPGPAVAIGPVRPAGPLDVAAGSPLTFAWAALDPFGEVVANFSAPISFVLTPPGVRGPTWVNSTLAGPVPPISGGFTLPSSDWQGGFLNFTVAFGAAGTAGIAFASALPLSAAPGGTLAIAVAPDVHHLVLSAPDVATGGSRTNATRWQIADRFGDPVPGGFVLVRAVFGPVTALWQSAILAGGAASFVWVNFTAPAATAGTIFVVSEWNQSLLPPIDVPAAPAPAAPIGWVVGAFAASSVAAAALIARRYRRRPSASAGPAPPPSAPSSPDVEEELKRLAEGRAHVLGRADPASPRTLDELADGFTGRPPTPEEMADWVGSLVAEGALVARVGDDGRPRFVRGNGGDRGGTGAPGADPPRVELDDRALEEALRRRDGDPEATGSPPAP